MSNDLNIAVTSLVLAVGSYFGWLTFTGINELFPSLASFAPPIKIMVGLAGLYLLVKLGFRKQP